jgi:hypothetical protein
MIGLFRFSTSRLALAYIALSVLVLALFAIPLWYAWSVNISTFRTYVDANLVQEMADQSVRSRIMRRSLVPQPFLNRRLKCSA